MKDQVGEFSKGNKAQFVREDGKKIPVQFNPSEYTITTGGQYSRKKKRGRDSSSKTQKDANSQFLGSTRGDLNLTLYFDTSEMRSVQNGMMPAKNVADKTGEIENLAVEEGSKHRPPLVTFIWGNFQYKGFVTSVSTTFTMFTESGMPVRAKMSVTMCDENNSRIPLESPDRTKTRILSEDSSLWNVARTEYGDVREWRRIAKANGIMNPFELEMGRELKVPAIIKED